MGWGKTIVVGAIVSATGWGVPKEVAERIAEFYRDPGPRPMWRVPPKERLSPRPASGANRPRLPKRRPRPSSTSSSENDDRLADLAETWFAPGSLVESLDGIPGTGSVQRESWSGDYWRANWGHSSYRYADGVKFKTWAEAIAAYAQPKDWTRLLQTRPEAAWPNTVLAWSPAEKYDLTVGDEAFTLTSQQKLEGETLVGEKGIIEEWMGLCDGWAPAAFMVPAAMKPVTVKGARGVDVTWYPEDIRAMASLAWTHGDYLANFIGGRCTTEKPATYPNGRLVQQECFDSNPATFHLALGNFVGKLRKPFVLDVAFDWEVWNQPIVGYETAYFNPMAPDHFDADWKKVAIDYSAEFKAFDRFQKPLTRGVRQGKTYDDKGIRKIVGAATTITYLDGSEAKHVPEPPAPVLVRVTYTYDLELHAKPDGRLYPQGGEWHQNAHPDFLWVPQKGTAALLAVDKTPLGYAIDKPAPPAVTTAAKKTSKSDGYPLCEVVRALVSASQTNPTGEPLYACR